MLTLRQAKQFRVSFMSDDLDRVYRLGLFFVIDSLDSLQTIVTSLPSSADKIQLNQNQLEVAFHEENLLSPTTIVIIAIAFLVIRMLFGSRNRPQPKIIYVEMNPEDAYYDKRNSFSTLLLSMIVYAIIVIVVMLALF